MAASFFPRSLGLVQRIVSSYHAALIPSDSRHTFISSVNLSGAISEDTDQYFTISCSDFKKFFDALSVLDIGKEVSEKNINQTILDDVENIFNTYAGNCTQLDEYEFE